MMERLGLGRRDDPALVQSRQELWGNNVMAAIVVKMFHFVGAGREP